MTQPRDDGDRSAAREGAPHPAAELARRRREVIKALHPDIGGDPEAFMAAMAALDAGRSAPADGDAAPPREGLEGFAAPRQGSAVRVTWRGRLRRARRKAARTVSRRRFIDVSPPR